MKLLCCFIFLVCSSTALATEDSDHASCSDILENVLSVYQKSANGAFGDFVPVFRYGSFLLEPQDAASVLYRADSRQVSVESVLEEIGDIQRTYRFPIYEMGDPPDRIPTVEESFDILALAENLGLTPQTLLPRFVEVMKQLDREASQGAYPSLRDGLGKVAEEP